MNNVSEEMKHVHRLAKRDPGKRFDYLWDLATDPAWLMQAWEEIRSNKGSMTAGIDSTIATDIDPERIQRLSGRLRTGKYRPNRYDGSTSPRAMARGDRWGFQPSKIESCNKHGA